MRCLYVFLLALILIVPVSAFAQGARFDNRACDPSFCDESGWLFDDNATDHVTIWRHKLGVTPRLISVMFSPDPAQRRVMPVIWSWHDANAGNPVSITMGARAVRLSIHKNAPLHGLWTPEARWERFNEGYWKIIVYK